MLWFRWFLMFQKIQAQEQLFIYWQAKLSLNVFNFFDIDTVPLDEQLQQFRTIEKINNFKRNCCKYKNRSILRSIQVNRTKWLQSEIYYKHLINLKSVFYKSITFSIVALFLYSTYHLFHILSILHKHQPILMINASIQNQKELKIVIQGVEIQITPLIYRQMQFLQQWFSLSAAQITTFEMKDKSIVSLKEWNMIVEILQKFNYKLPELAKVKTNITADVIGVWLAKKFDKLSRSELNRLYVASHFLKIKNLRAAIACYFGSKVYISQQSDYEERLKINNIKSRLTYQLQTKYRESYSFLSKY